jgi:hypothetical protein
MLRFIVQVVAAAEAGPLKTGLAVRFEEVLASLAKLPRMFIEPDGSFVWRGTSDDGQPWQVDGNLIDRGDVLACVELKGSCPAARLDDILRGLGWPEATLWFQLPRLGLLLTEAEFRQRAATPEGAG